MVNMEHTNLIIDTVINITTSRIYSLVSPYRGQKVWIITCKENKVKVLLSLGNDKVKAFIDKVPTGTLINKKFCFTVNKRASYVFNVEEVKN